MPQVCELLPVSGSEAFGAVPGPLWPRPPAPRTQLGCCPSRAEVAAAALLHVAQCATGRTRRCGSERRGLCCNSSALQLLLCSEAHRRVSAAL